MWQLNEKPVPFGKFNFCYMSLQLFFQVGATAVLRLGWRGILAAQGLLAFFTTLLALALLRKNNWLAFRFDKNCLRFGLKFGLGYIPNVLAVRLNDSMGRLFLSQKFNLAETGIYAAGQKLGAIVNVYSSSFASVYNPWLLKKLSDDTCCDIRKITLSVLLASASVILFAWGGSLCMYIFSGFVLGENFERSLIFVFWSASAYALNGMYGIVSLFIYHTGKSWILSLLTVTAVGLNALFTWRFIRLYGIIGVAYAPVLAWAVTLALAVLVALRLWKSGHAGSRPNVVNLTKELPHPP
jgi:O-antigen/teichoic acid export membrane protein